MMFFKRSKILKRIVVAVTILLGLIIAMISLSSIPLIGSIGPIGIDKIYHALAFFSLVFPLSLVRPRLILWILLGVMAFGGFIELAQGLFGRQFDWADFIANGIGAIFGALIARQLGFWFFLSDNMKIFED